jgi:hypothetical protein
MELTVNEAERIAVLYKFGVLDSEFEERFDRLTRLWSRTTATRWAPSASLIISRVRNLHPRSNRC